mmetsp:Transcript_42842/g.69474  ORF Transcript_42842/g.69474 Transcript_42842/m.69474 type:complete len:84 (+) Transcript_42842:69-320(+)
MAQSNQPARLKILCLHGHAQSASHFKGRTNAVRKAIKSIADLEYIDAPHRVDVESNSSEAGEDPNEKEGQVCGTRGGYLAAAM